MHPLKSDHWFSSQDHKIWVTTKNVNHIRLLNGVIHFQDTYYTENAYIKLNALQNWFWILKTLGLKLKSRHLEIESFSIINELCESEQAKLSSYNSVFSP